MSDAFSVNSHQGTEDELTGFYHLDREIRAMRFGDGDEPPPPEEVGTTLGAGHTPLTHVEGETKIKYGPPVHYSDPITAEEALS